MTRPSSLVDTRIIYCGDCLEQLKQLPPASVDLAYIDPPFNSNRNYEVFWARPRRSARLRTGTRRRTTAHADTNGFGHVHGILLRYSNGEPGTFNVELRPYPQAYIDRYFIYEDEHAVERGKHWRDNITGSGLRNGETGEVWRGVDPATIGKGRHWIRRPSELDQMANDGRVYFPPDGGTPKLKRYANELEGIPIDSIWEDIPSLGRLSKAAKESLGYPTQKPVALLDRII